MTDTREDILERLREIGAAVTGINYAVRNVLDITESRLPAVVVLEGDEEPTIEQARNRPAQIPIPMIMTPELCVVAIDGSETVGTTLNAFRAELIKDVTGDATLRTLVGLNGAVKYRGMVSDLGLGRAMLGRMSLRFNIHYVIYPDQL
jgi:hypothetical protein